MKKRLLITLLSCISIICMSQNKNSLSGTYMYMPPYNFNERMCIVINETKEGEIQGLFYGTTDEFDEVREGYLPGFFIANMDNIYLDTTKISFKLNISRQNLFCNPIYLSLKTSEEIHKSKNKLWHVWGGARDTSRTYSGMFARDTIFFREEGVMKIQDVIFLKGRRPYEDKLFYKVDPVEPLEPVIPLSSFAQQSVSIRIDNIMLASRNVGTKVPQGDIALNYTNDTTHVDHKNSLFKGDYYTWEEAKTACPSGWRLPSSVELADIERNMNTLYGTTYLEDSAGNRCYFPLSGGLGNSSGVFGGYWSSTESYGGSNNAIHLSVTSRGGSGVGINEKQNSLSVRCVKYLVTNQRDSSFQPNRHGLKISEEVHKSKK